MYKNYTVNTYKTQTREKQRERSLRMMKTEEKQQMNGANVHNSIYNIFLKAATPKNYSSKDQHIDMDTATFTYIDTQACSVVNVSYELQIMLNICFI